MYILLGIFLYNILPLPFIDELFAISLPLLLLFSKGKKVFKNKEFVYFVLIYCFFVLYSFFYSVNRIIWAIILDSIQLSKPFWVFYSMIIISPRLNKLHMFKLKTISLLLGICSIGLFVFTGPYGGFFGHPANYGNTIFTLAISYLFFSDRSKYNIKVSLLLLFLGLLCARSKYIAEFLVFVYWIFICKGRVQFNIRYLVTMFFVAYLIFVLIASKLSLYVTGVEDGQARTILYFLMPSLLLDYFPFGSGLASYATWFSGVYYSPLYGLYNIDHVYGITEDYYDFIADTFFPALAEIGVVGIWAFFNFWVRRYRNSIRKLKNGNDLFQYKLLLIIVSYYFIESIAAPTFVTNYGILPMIILALLENDCYDSKNNSLLLVRRK